MSTNDEYVVITVLLLNTLVTLRVNQCCVKDKTLESKMGLQNCPKGLNVKLDCNCTHSRKYKIYKIKKYTYFKNI